MKKITFTLLISLCCCWLAAQCPTDDITFSTQGQIDSFQINYPNCTEIEDSLTISGADINDLGGLSNLHSIGEALIIKNCTSLTDLEGLENLQSIEGSFRISNNAGLSSLSGLNGLESINGAFWLTGNPVLLNLQGLDKLSYIGVGTQIIFGSTVRYGLVIEDNHSLSTLLGLDSLKTVTGGMRLCFNNALSSLNGLGNLQSVGTEPNPFFPSATFSITGNNNLESLSALENLETFKGYSIEIRMNANLVSLNGLDSVEFVGTGEAAIRNNPNLSVCDITPVCEFFNIPDFFFDVSGNAPGCEDLIELYFACMASPTNEIFSENPVIRFSPNPATDILQIQITNNEKWDIRFYDLLGRQLFRQEVSGTYTVSVKDWPAGVYVCSAVSGGARYTGRFVKE